MPWKWGIFASRRWVCATISREYDGRPGSISTPLSHAPLFGRTVLSCQFQFVPRIESARLFCASASKQRQQQSLPKRARTALLTEGRVAIVVRPFSDGRPFSPANDVHAVLEHVHVGERRVSELLRLLVERIDRERPGCIRHIVGEPWQPLPCEGIPSVEPAICRGQCVANQQDTAQVASESARSSRSHPEPRRQREARTCP